MLMMTQPIEMRQKGDLMDSVEEEEDTEDHQARSTEDAYSKTLLATLEMCSKPRTEEDIEHHEHVVDCIHRDPISGLQRIVDICGEHREARGDNQLAVDSLLHPFTFQWRAWTTLGLWTAVAGRIDESSTCPTKSATKNASC